MSEASSQKHVHSAPGSSLSSKTPPSDGSGRSLARGDNERTIISPRSPIANLSFSRGAPSLEAASLLEGERLGQFILQRFVGGGGMGIVFRALDTTLNREVALKVLSRDQSGDEEALRRFRNEAQSAARLDHDNIARVHYVGEDRGVHYIVFEYIEGVNIRDLVEQRGPLPIDEAVSFTFQIAQALDHASQRAVIHRDIKPSNVLITPDGKAKLVDMGLARLNQVAQADNDLTASGVTLGTFDYISPEQARDPRSADVRSDLYSLGCSFFYMLTGRPPFPEGTVLQKLLQHQGDHPPDPRTFRAELPVEITWILARLLAKNPAQRYQQPSELTTALGTLADKLGVHLSSPRTAWSPPRTAGQGRWQRHLPWMVPVAALFLVVLALDHFGTPLALDRETAGSAPPDVARVPAGERRPGNQGGKAVERAAAAPARVKEPIVPAPGNNPAPARVEPAVEPAVENPESEPTAAARAAGATLSGELGFESLGGRAAAVGGAASQLAPQPLGNSSELGISGEADTSRDARGSSSARPAAARDSVLVVSDAEGPHNYPSLRAAIGEAKSGDVIELRYSGRRVEKPMSISNSKLTIRAGEHFQPVVVFRPEPNPVEYPPSMLTIAGGELSAAGVHWELDLPREVSAEWALFETRRADLIHFERCSFTIRNASRSRTAYHADVAFFDVKGAPGTSSVAMDPTDAANQSVTIDLQSCVARGEATLVCNNELQALRLNWDNGLLATSERLLVAGGGSSLPAQSGHVQINLRHVTVAVQNGLALLTNTADAPYQLLTEINCTDSIILSTASPPLVEQRGSDNVDEYLSRLQWLGDGDFFDGFEVFWQILDTATGAGAKQMQFADWRSYWSSRLKRASNATVVWKGRPPSDRPYHVHTPGDYALDATRPNNPPRGAASDGLDAGCVGAQLAPLPPDERADASGPRTSIAPARDT